MKALHPLTGPSSLPEIDAASAGRLPRPIDDPAGTSTVPSSQWTDSVVDEDRIRRALVAMIGFGCRHWLFAVNTFLVVFSTLPVLAPIFAAMGLESISNAIFVAYSLTCHQMPSRSYFIFGHQMAYCERNTAIYFSMTLTGLVYARVRERGIRRLPWYWYLVLITPMAIDGFTQLFGWRESTWLLRGITGTLFGVATVWLAFPCLEQSFDQIESEL